MKNGIRVGRLFGVDIFIDWSWIFIFLLVTWNLAAMVFPELHPEWSLWLNLFMGIIASLLFFASVLAHELAHSLVAKARGLPVRSISLFIFGGVSNIEREPPSPATEFFMTIVGPLTSFVLGILFLYLGGRGADLTNITLNTTTQALAGLDPLSTILLYLGPINLLLAVFNLIPGFPLDGGRILRSILWASTNNLRKATRWATIVGQVVAWAFIITGVAMIFGVEVPFFGTGIIGGLWLVFIGWFLNNAAEQSYRQVVVEDILEGIPVSRIMRANTPTVPPQTTISELVDRYFMGTDERSFPVVYDDSLVGLVTLDDIRKVPRTDWDDTIVQDIMTPSAELEIADPSEDVTEAMGHLNERDVRQLPVVENGRLVGILRRRDILRWLQLHSEARA